MQFRTLLITCALLLASTGSAQIYMTRDGALKHYFANGTVERKTLFLTQQQVEQIEAKAKSKLESKIVTYYVGRKEKAVLGYAFFDTHVVRTMPEAFVAVINPDGTLHAVEILAFYEPEDYLPPKRWLSLFQNKVLDGDLWVKRGIQHISGATLSTQAITSAVRRLLATFEVAVPKENTQ